MASYPGVENVRADALKEIRLLETSFNRVNERRFKIERIIGEGTGGFALKMAMINDPSPVPRPVQRFVIKRAYNKQQADKLQEEIQIVQKFRGNMHVAQLIVLPGESTDGISYLNGPTLMTDWIGNGTVKDLIAKRSDWRQPLPNRVLWRLFLCLCRMLIAMAWPSNGPPGAPREVELLSSPDPNGNRPTKSGLVHGDLNIQNILVGNLDQREHSLVNTLMLIDFGNARTLDVDQAEEAVKSNMANMGEIMFQLIGGGFIRKSQSSNMKVTVGGQDKIIRSWARDLDGLSPTYEVPADTMALHRDSMENLDPDLKSLVVQCLAVAPVNRPDLETLVEEVERNVDSKTATSYASYKYKNNETDNAAIYEQVERNVDADAARSNRRLPALDAAPPAPGNVPGVLTESFSTLVLLTFDIGAASQNTECNQGIRDRSTSQCLPRQPAGSDVAAGG
ncbi:kinase-like domain-containing protein [Hypoxylon cercidicola]|nr:kinase-like domain-containing protein [Hypoxylon cercidicola]